MAALNERENDQMFDVKVCAAFEPRRSFRGGRRHVLKLDADLSELGNLEVNEIAEPPAYGSSIDKEVSCIDRCLCCYFKSTALLQAGSSDPQ